MRLWRSQRDVCPTDSATCVEGVDEAQEVEQLEHVVVVAVGLCVSGGAGGHCERHPHDADWDLFSG